MSGPRQAPSGAIHGELAVPTPDDMVALGRRLADQLRAGDLLLLSGDLGAGKTTLTRGIGDGLGVRGAVTSPTFVIARVHPAPAGRPPLVHVDAYRLDSLAEVDDLDLDAAQEDSVTVVEWGRGLAEDLAADRLELDLSRPRGLGTGRPRPRGRAVADVDGRRALGGRPALDDALGDRAGAPARRLPRNLPGVLLLAFDTATPAVTVALHDGSRVLAERTTVDARRQGELLAPHIVDVLAPAGDGPPT